MSKTVDAIVAGLDRLSVNYDIPMDGITDLISELAVALEPGRHEDFMKELCQAYNVFGRQVRPSSNGVGTSFQASDVNHLRALVKDWLDNFDPRQIRVFELQLLTSGHTYIPWERDGVYTFGDLCKMTRDDLLRIQGLGPKSADQIEQALEVWGLSLKGIGKERRDVAGGDRGEEPEHGRGRVQDARCEGAGR